MSQGKLCHEKNTTNVGGKVGHVTQGIREWILRESKARTEKSNRLTATSVAGTGLPSVSIIPSREYPTTLLQILFFLVNPVLSRATPMAGGALGLAHIAWLDDKFINQRCSHCAVFKSHISVIHHQSRRSCELQLPQYRKVTSKRICNRCESSKPILMTTIPRIFKRRTHDN